MQAARRPFGQLAAPTALGHHHLAARARREAENLPIARELRRRAAVIQAELRADGPRQD
jgi:hypothetical protein